MENADEVREWNPKGGRPKLSQEERKGKVFKLRLTEKERADLEQQANEAGYKDLSEYVRRKLFTSNDTPIHNPKKLFRAMDQMGRALKKIGNNINQITKYIHYLEQNNMVEPKVIGEFNRYFREFLDVEEAYVKAIRAYLRTVR